MDAGRLSTAAPPLRCAAMSTAAFKLGSAKMPHCTLLYVDAARRPRRMSTDRSLRFINMMSNNVERRREE